LECGLNGSEEIEARIENWLEMNGIFKAEPHELKIGKKCEKLQLVLNCPLLLQRKKKQLL